LLREPTEPRKADKRLIARSEFRATMGCAAPENRARAEVKACVSNPKRPPHTATPLCAGRDGKQP